MDIDGDGTVSYAEFLKGLREFGCDLTEIEMHSLMDALDFDADGKLKLEDFATAVKTELEFLQADGNEAVHLHHGLGEVHNESYKTKGDAKVKEMRQEMVVAMHQGVRFTRTNSTFFDPTRQCDLSMVTKAAIKKRMEVSKNPKISTAFSKWWRAIHDASGATKTTIKLFNNEAVAPRFEEGKGKVGKELGKDARQALNMKKAQYVTLLVTLSRHLNPMQSEVKARAQALKDWEVEKNPATNFMDYSHFKRAIFELVDTWVDGLELQQYLDFIKMCQSLHIGKIQQKALADKERRKTERTKDWQPTRPQGPQLRSARRSQWVRQKDRFEADERSTAAAENIAESLVVHEPEPADESAPAWDDTALRSVQNLVLSQYNSSGKAGWVRYNTRINDPRLVPPPRVSVGTPQAAQHENTGPSKENKGGEARGGIRSFGRQEAREQAWPARGQSSVKELVESAQQGKGHVPLERYRRRRASLRELQMQELLENVQAGHVPQVPRRRSSVTEIIQSAQSAQKGQQRRRRSSVKELVQGALKGQRRRSSVPELAESVQGKGRVPQVRQKRPTSVQVKSKTYVKPQRPESAKCARSIKRPLSPTQKKRVEFLQQQVERRKQATARREALEAQEEDHRWRLLRPPATAGIGQVVPVPERTTEAFQRAQRDAHVAHGPPPQGKGKGNVTSSPRHFAPRQSVTIGDVPLVVDAMTGAYQPVTMTWVYRHDGIA
jgi:hypothetical protein